MKTLLHVAAAFLVLLLDWVGGRRGGNDEAVRDPILRFVLKHPWMTAGALASALVVGGALVVVLGVVPIKASSGHWAITARVLDFAKLQSVKTHSLRIEAPPLDDEVLVLRGATHYETGCHPCHGRSGATPPPVMAAMTPPPPQLTGERLTRWMPEQLFSMVKHGIKFTGMPAWPAQQRDDEVWAVVAFLRRLPGLDAAGYERLVQSPAPIPLDTTAAEQFEDHLTVPVFVRTVCSRCHGLAGTGRGPDAFPSLAGQRAAYMVAALRAFADRTRHSGIMAPIAATLDRETMREVTAYYERLPARTLDTTSDAEAIARGEAIATRGVPQRDIPACVECHGPSAQPKNPSYPMLAGQHARYLREQLGLLRARQRGGSPQVNLMYAFVDRLSADEIDHVTRYYASLQPGDFAIARPPVRP
jgi:cytochrome c553